MRRASIIIPLIKFNNNNSSWGWSNKWLAIALNLVVFFSYDYLIIYKIFARVFFYFFYEDNIIKIEVEISWLRKLHLGRFALWHFYRSRFTMITLTYLSRRFTRRERRDSILTWMQTLVSFTKLLNTKDTNFIRKDTFVHWRISRFHSEDDIRPLSFSSEKLHFWCN